MCEYLIGGERSLKPRLWPAFGKMFPWEADLVRGRVSEGGSTFFFGTTGGGLANNDSALGEVTNALLPNQLIIKEIDLFLELEKSNKDKIM